MEPFTGILTLAVFTPLAGAILIVLAARKDSTVRLIALSVTLFNFILSGIIFFIFDNSSSQRFQMVERVEWFNSQAINATYQMGVDGISAPLVLLTGLLGFIAVLASWKIVLRVKEYFVWILILQTAVMGVFTSLDFILFFVFWELELIPMYFLISIWGTGRKQYSAMKFVIFTFLGSAFMLVGIIALYLSPDVRHFDMIILAENGVMGIQSLVPLTLIFWFFLIGFLVKLPAIPVHTWLPDAHTDAPTAVSILLAGVLLKMGGYGFLRFSIGLFPVASEIVVVFGAQTRRHVHSWRPAGCARLVHGSEWLGGAPRCQPVPLGCASWFGGDHICLHALDGDVAATTGSAHPACYWPRPGVADRHTHSDRSNLPHHPVGRFCRWQ